MYTKVLIAEDIDSINITLSQTLSQLGAIQVDHIKYCDDALIRIKKAIADDAPYDLLITDLSFEPDHRPAVIKSGQEAIEKIRILQPGLKIIVYSIEDKSFRIKSLFEKSKINGYVHKGRESIEQLKTAIAQTQVDDAIYLSPNLQYILKDKSTREIDDFDIKIIQQLALGITQDEMEARFKELGITPNSKSTIEKRISKLKDHFMAANTVQLIVKAKDMGIV
jgi:two-component system capsular synthesis response regulator RcsB